MGQLPAAPESFSRTEAWLLKLEAANRQRRVFAPEALADMLNYVWFRMSMAAVRTMGGEAWERHRRSPLALMGPRSRLRRWTMRAAAWKADLGGRRG